VIDVCKSGGLAVKVVSAITVPAISLDGTDVMVFNNVID